MIDRRHSIATTLLLASVALPVSFTMADESTPAAPGAGGACALCPDPAGWAGEWRFGMGWANGANPGFADYRGIDDNGAWPSLNGKARYLDDLGRYLDVRVHEPALDSRRIEARGGRRGVFEWRLDYAEVPRYRGFGTASPFRGVGGDVLTLPSDWVPAADTSGMSALGESLAPVSLRLDRRFFTVGFRHIVTPQWQWEATAARDERSGTRAFGAGLFTLNTSHFPAPVDDATDRLDLAVTWAGDSGSLTAGVGASRFDNDVASVTWDNPFDPVGGASRFRAALAPGNTFYRASLGGGWRPSRRLRFSGRLSLGRAEQDDPLLPYTINPELPDTPLPVPRIDGRVDVGSLDIGGSMSVRLITGLDLRVRYRKRERDNHTPVLAWTPVVTDLAPRPPTLNRPYSFDRQDLSAALAWSATPAMRVEAGVRRRDMERTLQAVSDSSETTGWVETAWQGLPSLGLRAGFEKADRDVPRYAVIQDPGLPENPLMRKFNMAARERSKGYASLDWTPVSAFSASLSWHGTDDRYDDTRIGLRDSEERRLALDLAVHPSDRISAHGFAAQDRIDARIDGAENFTRSWRSVSRDTFLTIGVGGDFTTSAGTSLGLDYVVAHADGDIDTRGEAPADAFPALTTELRNLRLHAGGQFTEHWGWRVAVEVEHYRSRDWQLDGIGVDGLPAVLALGAMSPDYDATLVSLLAVYRP